MIGAIVLLRLNAFLALIAAALTVSLLAPGEPAIRVLRVAEGFGRTAGNIGIVIALASVIGKAMMDSGAADRIVRAFLALLGERRGATALGATGFVLSIPVFFDTVFYLLVPLARSMHARTSRDYLRYLMAIAAGAAATHTLVPPTPGPLAVASSLGVDLGTMVLMGFLVALPAATAGGLFARWMNTRLTIVPPASTSAVAARAIALPGLAASLTPIVLPVVLIAANTLVTSLTAPSRPHAAFLDSLAPWMVVLGNPNVALLLAAGIALRLYARQTGATRSDVATMTESALEGSGMIILITAAGGAFGATLQAAQVGPAIQGWFNVEQAGTGLSLLLLAFGMSSLLKIAQGSSTVAMITTAGMLGALLAEVPTLPYHRVYVATAIASGSLVGTWMNDSGFWVFSRLGGTTEIETLRTWTPLSAIVGVTALLTTLLLALVLPLR
ncbi:MAG: gluconate permease [Cytophagaceae bacterium]|nr:gluconate permease [Gemmatimonadaceae bacterium]